MKKRALFFLLVCLQMHYHTVCSERRAKKQRLIKTRRLQRALDEDRINIPNLISLIKGGANPRTRSKSGITAFHTAIIHCHPELAECCLKKRVDPNETFNGQTPLMRVTTAAMVNLLIANRAAVHAQDSIGKTALHRHGQASVDNNTLSLLCKAGANVNHTDQDGNTPLHDVCVRYRAYYFQDKMITLCMEGADTTLRNKRQKTSRDELLQGAPYLVDYYDEIVALVPVVCARQEQERASHLEVYLPAVCAGLVIDYAGSTGFNEAGKRKIIECMARTRANKIARHCQDLVPDQPFISKASCDRLKSYLAKVIKCKKLW